MALNCQERVIHLIHGTTRLFDGRDDEYAGEDLVSRCGFEGQLWQPYTAEDLGLLATLGAGYGDSAVNGSIWACDAATNTGVFGDPVQ